MVLVSHGAFLRKKSHSAIEEKSVIVTSARNTITTRIGVDLSLAAYRGLP